VYTKSTIKGLTQHLRIKQRARSEGPLPLVRKNFSGTELISEPVQKADYISTAVQESIRTVNAR